MLALSIRHVFSVLLAVSLAYPLLAAGRTPARIFTQAGFAVDATGKSVPPLVLDPATLGDLVESRFELGRGRLLIVRTDIPSARHSELKSMAGAIRRCHDSVERNCGREVRGDMLIYLLWFERIPRSYSFRVELEDPGRWSQVRLAMTAGDAPLTGVGATPQLRKLLYGTLAHELGHQLLDAVPTVAHDIGERSSRHTRWFIEGVCEWLALDFARTECRPHAWRLLADRRVERVLESARVREHLLRWAQTDQLDWQLESDLYGAALLVVDQWLSVAPLPHLLAALADTGGQHDGADLQDQLATATGLSRSELFERAAATGRRWAAPAVSRR
jgi:hypothetical protein